MGVDDNQGTNVSHDVDIVELDELDQESTEDIDTDTYRVITEVPYMDKSAETKIYKLDRDGLNQYLNNFHLSGERVIDIRPVNE